MRISRFVASAATALALTGAAVGAGVAPVSAGPADLGGADAPIRPGVQTITAGAGQCTANFVFTNGTDVFLGQAAHCSGAGAATATDGCDQAAAPLPIGTAVEIVGFDGNSYGGTLAYSSWNTMIAAGETNPDTCAYNDFALVRINPADHDATNSSLPYWGGPDGTRAGATAAGDAVYSYGNSSLRGGISLLSPKSGIAVSTDASGWSHTIYTLTPGVPGDSGSAVLDADGAALGILVTVAVAPLPLSNGVTDIDRALAYASANGGLGSLSLIDGTEAFDAGALVPGLPGLPFGK
jgi:hypothetical protein